MVQVDFLPAKALDREAMQAEQARLDGIRKATRTVSTIIDGQQRDFLLFFTKTMQTNGGYMFDVRVGARSALIFTGLCETHSA